jgi:flagellar hook assembly protein FlgD
MVRTLVDENQPAGARDVTWDGRSDGGVTVASGVYFCKMTAGKFTETRRMVMLK